MQRIHFQTIFPCGIYISNFVRVLLYYVRKLKYSLLYYNEIHCLLRKIQIKIGGFYCGTSFQEYLTGDEKYVMHLTDHTWQKQMAFMYIEVSSNYIYLSSFDNPVKKCCLIFMSWDIRLRHFAPIDNTEICGYSKVEIRKSKIHPWTLLVNKFIK